MTPLQRSGRSLDTERPATGKVEKQEVSEEEELG